MKTCEIVHPFFIKYNDKTHMIVLVKFDNDYEWVPNSEEIELLLKKLNECYNWNLKNDVKGRAYSRAAGEEDLE